MGVVPEDTKTYQYEDILKLCLDNDSVAQIWFDALQQFSHESRVAVYNESRVIKANGLKAVEAEQHNDPSLFAYVYQIGPNPVR